MLPPDENLVCFDTRTDETGSSRNIPLHKAKDEGVNYEPEVNWGIQIMYIVAIVVWIFIIYALSLYRTDWLGWLILLIPFVVFAINYSFVGQLTADIEDFMLQGNFLYLTFIIIIVMINWEKVGNKNRMFKLAGIALVLLVLSIIDIWVPRDKIIYTKHFTGILQTLAAVIITYTLYLYYCQLIIPNPYPNE